MDGFSNDGDEEAVAFDTIHVVSKVAKTMHSKECLALNEDHIWMTMKMMTIVANRLISKRKVGIVTFNLPSPHFLQMMKRMRMV